MSNKAEKQWMADVASLGCVACRNAGYGESPAEVHHIRETAGAGQKATDYETIPLCVPHHRTGGSGVAIHAGEKTWERKFGTELELLEQTVREVHLFRESIVGRAV